MARSTPLLSAGLFVAVVVVIGCSHTAAESSASSIGVITGTLAVIGGPAPGTPRPIEGTVTATNQTHQSRFHTAAGNDGQFELRLPPGIFTVIRSTPAY